MKKKLSLSSLKIESFVTSIDLNTSNTVKGGRTEDPTACVIGPPSQNAFDCGITGQQSCYSYRCAGSHGTCATDGCSNNSCGICVTQ